MFKKISLNYKSHCGYQSVIINNIFESYYIFPFSQGIEKIAWDASGERLAVSFKGGDDLYRGLIGIYDARRTPLVSASLV